MKILSLTLLLTCTLNSSVVLANQVYQPKTCAPICSEQAADGYNSEYSKIFKTMEEKMNEAPNTGNINLDFIVEMYPHHVGGIDMAKAIVKYGSNPEVKKIADNIIKNQEAQLPEIEKLKAEFSKDTKSNKVETKDYLVNYKKIKEKMFEEMKNIKPNSNPDITFLNQMIVHHDAAIKMAKNLLKYTKNPELKKLANNIIIDQTKGIKEMKSTLKSID